MGTSEERVEASELPGWSVVVIPNELVDQVIATVNAADTDDDTGAFGMTAISGIKAGRVNQVQSTATVTQPCWMSTTGGGPLIPGDFGPLTCDADVI